jgi:hypothetical protein
MMKKKLLAFVVSSAFAAPVLAADDSGLYLVGLVGTTTNISNVDSGQSFGGFFGYRFNEVAAVEAGMVSLVDKANYLVPPVGYGGTGTYTSTSLAGSDLAAVLSLPVSDYFSGFLRLGYAGMERTDNPSPAEVETKWSGSTYGLGLQFMLPYDFGVGGGKMQIGFRAGYNLYNLKDSTGTLTASPSNTYVGGVIMF